MVEKETMSLLKKKRSLFKEMVSGVCGVSGLTVCYIVLMILTFNFINIIFVTKSFLLILKHAIISLCKL